MDINYSRTFIHPSLLTIEVRLSTTWIELNISVFQHFSKTCVSCVIFLSIIPEMSKRAKCKQISKKQKLWWLNTEITKCLIIELNAKQFYEVSSLQHLKPLKGHRLWPRHCRWRLCCHWNQAYAAEWRQEPVLAGKLWEWSTSLTAFQSNGLGFKVKIKLGFLGRIRIQPMSPFTWLLSWNTWPLRQGSLVDTWQAMMPAKQGSGGR